MPNTVMSITTTEAARRWAVATLRDVADQLEGAPRHRVADAMLQLAGALEELSRRAACALRMPDA